MALKAVVTDISTVPEAFRSEYTQVGNEYRLAIDGEVPGFVPSAKLNEFRDNNRRLTEEAQTLKQQLDALKEIDPVEYKRLKEEVGKKGKGESEEEYQRRLQAALKPVQTELETSRTENTKLQGELAKLRINDAAVAAGAEYGIRPSAQADLVNRISGFTKLENGIPVIYDEKGEKRYSNKTGDLLTIKEAVAELVEKAPHLFEPSTGTQSKGPGNNGAGSLGSGPNPFKKESWNLTRQSEIMAKDKVLAKKLADEAGVKLRI